jgi:hypothetical protein
MEVDIMKKTTTVCLGVLTFLTVGCSVNKTNLADAIEAGADPSQIAPAAAAGAPEIASECNLNHPRPLWRQNRKLRNRAHYRKKKQRNCTQ